IRDWSVTGVQTCALPIYPVSRHSAPGNPAFSVRQRRDAVGFSVRSIIALYLRLAGKADWYVRGRNTWVLWSDPYHFPEIHVNCRVNLAHNALCELEFRQYSFDPSHLTLTIIR